METNNKNRDYRFETKDDARDFHRARKAFVIYDGRVLFIKEGSTQSHWEFCQENIANITKDEFNKLTRGYYLNGDLVFYKDNFIYDDEVIKEALNYIDIIKKECEVEKVKVYFGFIIDESVKIWPFDYFYKEM